MGAPRLSQILTRHCGLARGKNHSPKHPRRYLPVSVGGSLAPFLATDAFRYLRTSLKIDASLHDLRHTAATWMLAGGIDVKTVATVLGHSAASTTLNVYGHIIAGTASGRRDRRPFAPGRKLAVFGRLLPFCNRGAFGNEKTLMP